MSSPQYWSPAKPRAVADGIKARSKRGAIAQTWWSSRFIEVLEGIVVGGRLQRGRNYARKGQVMDLHTAAGVVTARVQGSRPRPYRVRIAITAFDKTQWARVERVLAGSASYAAALLAGEMPRDIEDAFTEADLSLFPADAADLSMDCSCPDYAVPCKHLAAVCYLLAESFDADPFAVLAWRGRDREDLLDNLAAHRDAADPDRPPPAGTRLADRLSDYFAAGAIPPPPEPPDTRPDTVLDQLPDTGVTVRHHSLPDLLRPAYDRRRS